MSGQVMTDRSVGSAEATPESRVRRALSTVSEVWKLFRVSDEALGSIIG